MEPITLNSQIETLQVQVAAMQKKLDTQENELSSIKAALRNASDPIQVASEEKARIAEVFDAKLQYMGLALSAHKVMNQRVGDSLHQSLVKGLRALFEQPMTVERLQAIARKGCFMSPDVLGEALSEVALNPSKESNTSVESQALNPFFDKIGKIGVLKRVMPDQLDGAMKVDEEQQKRETRLCKGLARLFSSLCLSDFVFKVLDKVEMQYHVSCKRAKDDEVCRSKILEAYNNMYKEAWKAAIDAMVAQRPKGAQLCDKMFKDMPNRKTKEFYTTELEKELKAYFAECCALQASC